MRLVRLTLVVVAAILAIGASSALADENIVAPDGSHNRFLTETLDGTILKATSLCMPTGGCLFPLAFGVAHDGAAVFHMNDAGPPGIAGIWLVTAQGAVRRLTSNLYH